VVLLAHSLARAFVVSLELLFYFAGSGAIGLGRVASGKLFKDVDEQQGILAASPRVSHCMF